MIAPQTAIAPNRMKRAGSIAPLLLQQHVDREDELLPGVVRGGEPPGVHPDRVARARLDAQTAEDAPEHVDVEPHRVLLDRRVGRLPRDDRDALRRARRGATVARYAAGAPVRALHPPVPPAKPGGHPPPDLGVLDRLDPLLADDVGEEVPHRDAQPLHDLHEVHRLRERHLPGTRHFFHADRHRPGFRLYFFRRSKISPVAKMLMIERGSITFHPSRITWSYRNRGIVHRTQT